MYSRTPGALPTLADTGTTAPSLLAEIQADPQSPVVVGIAGVGGSGKRVLLDEIEALYRAAGVPVARGTIPSAGLPRPGFRAVLVDDAQTHPDAELAVLLDLVLRGDVTVIASFRPWPRSTMMLRLIRALESDRPSIALGTLTHGEIAERLRDAAARPVPLEFVERVSQLTGSRPWLVQHVIETIRDSAPSVFREPTMPIDVAERIGSEIALLDQPLRELLLALAVGFDATGDLVEALQLDADTVRQLLNRATADGLLLSSGEPVPLIRHAVMSTSPTPRVRDFQRILVDSITRAGLPLDTVAGKLVHDGMHDSRVNSALEDAADKALRTDPSIAAKLYEQSKEGGADDRATGARRAQAAVALGDLDEGGRIVDELLALDDPPDLPRAADVAASIWAQRGMMERSAEIYRWIGPDTPGISASLGAITMIASGDRPGADAMFAAVESPASPTLLRVSTNLLGSGIRRTLDDHDRTALATLVRASDMMTASRSAVPLPDVPAALAALVALHGGDLDIAASVLDDALVGEQCGHAAQPRLILLRAWVSMQADQLQESRDLLAVALGWEGELSPREELLARALEIGLARRSDDPLALTQAWRASRTVLLHTQVDLFSLLPLGEMLIAGARLHDSQRLENQLSEAWALLERLGRPALWSVPLHWAAVQAAILMEKPADLAPHGAALVRLAPHSHLAATMASAGKVWISVLAGDVNTAQVEANARALASIGFTWDGSRLAGHAAPRAAERKDMARLLATARDLRASGSAVASPVIAEPKPDTAGATDPPDPGTPATGGRPTRADPRIRPHSDRHASGLSAREREVGRLVLEGKTYREIGETIFISARTAEHHIARIRRQLGATNRADLLMQLRIALGDDEAGR